MLFVLEYGMFLILRMKFFDEDFIFILFRGFIKIDSIFDFLMYNL